MPEKLSLLQLVEEGLRIKRQIEEAIAAETNARRRKAMKAACDKGDLAAIKELLFEVR